ncbi:TetR/AcrR family transcriptional regulator [Lysobacter enzymogenes]|nr:TetR/AcrR family transcriptional regulator [Lysobacter enzymogenes]
MKFGVAHPEPPGGTGLPAAAPEPALGENAEAATDAAAAKPRRPRGRPRGFDRDQALETAMRMFWQRGFEATSMSELTAAIGVAAPSLYAAFGSKEDLFRAALQRYLEQFRRGHGSVLATPGLAAREAFARLFDALAEGFAACPTRSGCMLVAAETGGLGDATQLREELARTAPASRPVSARASSAAKSKATCPPMPTRPRWPSSCRRSCKACRSRPATAPARRSCARCCASPCAPGPRCRSRLGPRPRASLRVAGRAAARTRRSRGAAPHAKPTPPAAGARRSVPSPAPTPCAAAAPPRPRAARAGRRRSTADAAEPAMRRPRADIAPCVSPDRTRIAGYGGCFGRLRYDDEPRSAESTPPPQRARGAQPPSVCP